MKKETVIYLDNAATSWPKPPGVAQAMTNFLESIGANPGRSGHRLSIQAARIVYDAREAIAQLFNAPDPMRVIFGLNITDGINLALHGLLHAGDHVITSSMEHNSVMRPLHDLEGQGVQITRLACQADGTLDPDLVERAIQTNTRMVVMNHASNVCGTILPCQAAAAIARRHNLLFLLDTAQTAGVLPLDMPAQLIDLLAFTGHKSLYGPMGTGGLVLGERVDVSTFHSLRQGGTGSRSEFEQQPDFLPDCFESGTPNAVGLAGLLASLRWLTQTGINQVRAHEQMLCTHMLGGLQNIKKVIVYGTHDAEKQTATIAFNIEGMLPSEVGLPLDEEYAILCRVGLHCAPAAHHTLGTFPQGCVRLSLGTFNTQEDIQTALGAIEQLSEGAA